MLLVFDLTRRSAFERLPELMRDIEEANPGLLVVLVGNKADGEVAVRSQEASIFAEKNGVKYFETVAVRNEQVSEAFSSLIAEIIAKIPNPPEPSSSAAASRSAASSPRTRRSVRRSSRPAMAPPRGAGLEI